MTGGRMMFALGLAIGIGAGTAIEAAGPAGSSPPVTVTLHRFDMAAGSRSTFDAWMAMLHERHGEAVATLDRERMYLEAMFVTPDDPRRLYWLTVEGEGGQSVESSLGGLDQAHTAYMDRVLVKGTHVRMTTRNILAPPFILAAVRQHQFEER